MNELPSGTVIFLFADIRDSTKLICEHPDDLPVFLARQIRH